jgi:copper/silver efflux system protein
MLIYMQFRSGTTAFIIFSSIAVAFGGGFMIIWLYGQPWFLDVSFLGANMRDVFQIGSINLSVAVWVGFIALFGIAADDGVVMATYLKQRFEEGKSDTIEAVRNRVVEAGQRRIRPCLMTTATTILALLPVLTSYGTGADVMIPMALPAVGGMAIALITLFVVPSLYCAVEELKVRLQ